METSKWKCPYCGIENDHSGIQCESCKRFLTEQEIIFGKQQLSRRRLIQTGEKGYNSNYEPFYEERMAEKAIDRVYKVLCYFAIVVGIFLPVVFLTNLDNSNALTEYFGLFLELILLVLIVNACKHLVRVITKISRNLHI